MNDVCLVVQGPSSYVNEIKQSVGDIVPLVFSTWVGEEHNYSSDDIVVFNTPPSFAGIGNLCYQHTSTINGLIKARDLGFSRAIKIRSDMIITNPRSFLNLFIKNLNFFYWHNRHGGYIVDYVMGGNINSMISLWDLELNKDWLHAEQALTHSFIKKFLYSGNYYFFGDVLDSNNDIIWMKYNTKLTDKSIYSIHVSYPYSTEVKYEL